MPKEGYKRIGCEIPEELHAKLTAFNKKATRPINIARLIEVTIEAELDKAEGN